jgi:hypothetical protein
MAHLSALIGLVLGLAFIGPLVVYVVKRDDPFVQRHAAEALNFNLSLLAYGTILALVPIAAACRSRRSRCSRSRGSSSCASPRRRRARRRVPVSADDQGPVTSSGGRRFRRP